MRKKILIATGGTGGHLFPARQLSEQLAECDIIFAGYKLDQTPFFDRKVPYVEIASAPKKRKIFSLFKGIWQSLKLLRRFRPDVVVGFGSYYSFPVLVAAALLRKKIVLFEANCTIGKVNRLFVPFAKKIAFQFPQKREKKVAYVPLLPWTKKIATPTKEEARAHYGLNPALFTILVFGGSQGAMFINKTFCAAAKLLPAIQVIHLTGKEDPEISYSVPAIVKPFESEMGWAYAAADLIVSRAGAGTVAELIRLQKPAIVIPYPYAYNHQKQNGEFLQEGARLLLQHETTPGKLAEEIVKMRGELATRQEALKRIVLPQTTDFKELVLAI